MEQTCPGQNSHPPSRVKISERSCEIKNDPFVAYALIILTLTKLTRLGDPKCLYGEKLALLVQEGDPTITKG